MPGFEMLDDGGGADPVQKPLQEVVFFADRLGGKSEVFAAGLKMFAGVHEVVAEGGRRECVAQGLLERLFPVGDALHPISRCAPPCPAQFADEVRDL